jgi:hypothetical protein
MRDIDGRGSVENPQVSGTNVMVACRRNDAACDCLERAFAAGFGAAD